MRRERESRATCASSNVQHSRYIVEEAWGSTEGGDTNGEPRKAALISVRVDILQDEGRSFLIVDTYQIYCKVDRTEISIWNIVQRASRCQWDCESIRGGARLSVSHRHLALRELMSYYVCHITLFYTRVGVAGTVITVQVGVVDIGIRVSSTLSVWIVRDERHVEIILTDERCDWYGGEESSVVYVDVVVYMISLDVLRDRTVTVMEYDQYLDTIFILRCWVLESIGGVLLARCVDRSIVRSERDLVYLSERVHTILYHRVTVSDSSHIDSIVSYTGRLGAGAGYICIHLTSQSSYICRSMQDSGLLVHMLGTDDEWMLLTLHGSVGSSIYADTCTELQGLDVLSCTCNYFDFDSPKGVVVTAYISMVEGIGVECVIDASREEGMDYEMRGMI
ncbi:hypothetical protein Tco_0680307 [Tanacetum coccineum]|uniref:Uncharacterized protein n=1 Tax=Tanacetum coccineum TaxID=301880 RepID=A0ABQ4XK72_9ASTR